jgi:hypothetical protein
MLLAHPAKPTNRQIRAVEAADRRSVSADQRPPS